MTRTAPLPAYALFAAMLASAGLPIYIHAPKVYADGFGVSLAALGAVLFGLRLIDLVQDPALGWLAGRLGRWRGVAAGVGVAVLGAAMLGLFAVTPPVAPLLWFALMLTALFSAYSFLTILFYARGVERASALGSGGHLRLAGWREGGALMGVSLAALAPAVLTPAMAAPYAGFAAGFAVLCLAAVVAMRGDWGAGRVAAGGGPGFGAVLADPLARRLLLLALLNAAPLAVTATLFLFFVESRLAAPGWEGPLLLLFFVAAAVAAPFWSRAARVFGARPVLLSAMALSIAAFGWAALLGPGDVWPFAVICVASGAALGADMVILPALFSRRLEEAGLGAGADQGFGLWSFASKFTLAFAAAVLLPLLDRAGFSSAGPNPEAALAVLGALYALLPCALKLVAAALLAATPIREDRE